MMIFQSFPFRIIHARCINLFEILVKLLTNVQNLFKQVVSQWFPYR